jgi:hypothetical protein
MSREEDTRLFILSRLGEFKQRRQWFNFYCPFHIGDSQSFGVNFDIGRFHCFGCNESGSINELKYRLKDKPLKPHVEIKEPAIFNNTVQPNWIQSTAKDLRFDNSFSGNMAKDYLYRRNFDYNIHECTIHEQYIGRVLIMFRTAGVLNYFVGRSFHPGITPKVKNPPADNGWASSSDVFWNMGALTGNIAIGEGVFDANAIQLGSGLPSTCLLQSVILDGHIRLLKAINPTSITLFLDSDAYEKSVIAACKLLDNGFKVRLVVWPREMQSEKSDPDSVHKDLVKRLVDTAIEVTDSTTLALSLLYAQFPC